jgi:hypothetical protein
MLLAVRDDGRNQAFSQVAPFVRQIEGVECYRDFSLVVDEPDGCALGLRTVAAAEIHCEANNQQEAELPSSRSVGANGFSRLPRGCQHVPTA